MIGENRIQLSGFPLPVLIKRKIKSITKAPKSGACHC